MYKVASNFQRARHRLNAQGTGYNSLAELHSSRFLKNFKQDEGPAFYLNKKCVEFELLRLDQSLLKHF